MTKITFSAPTKNNCLKIKKKFELLKIKSKFEHHTIIKCYTPNNCYLEFPCTITTDDDFISRDAKKYIKNLQEQNKIKIINN